MLARAAEIIASSSDYVGEDEPAGEMSPEDTARWHSARTLADLGELTALFLEGEISETPSHGGPPDPETGPLIPVLAAVNRAGFVTHQSQPRIPLDEDGSAQRANVSGFADSFGSARTASACFAAARMSRWLRWRSCAGRAAATAMPTGVSRSSR